MPDYAVDFCDADLVVRTPLKHADKGSSLKLYETERPPFISVTLNPSTAVPAIEEAIELGVFRVAVFDAEDDICRDKGKLLREVVESTKNLHQHLRFHAISGLHPERVTPDLAKMFAERTFAELYFEQSEEELELDGAAYEQCQTYLREAGIDLSDGNKTCGFVWIGRPNESLEGIVRRSFSVLSTFGSVILKPYTTVPEQNCSNNTMSIWTICRTLICPHTDFRSPSTMESPGTSTMTSTGWRRSLTRKSAVVRSIF